MLRPTLSPPLRAHLVDIDIESISRLSTSRLAEKAIPKIGTIELVDSDTFATKYDSLYSASFPKRLERERSDLIITRLSAQFAGKREGLAPYHIVGIRDSDGGAIGAAHFSVLPIDGGQFVVPYLQYIYVRSANRRQDMSEVLHTMTLAVAIADAQAMGGRAVPVTMFETDPPGYGHDDESRAFSTLRAKVHANGGAVAVVLNKDGKQLSPHVQPGLEVGDSPLTVCWVLRPSPVQTTPWTISDLGNKLLKAYYQNIRDEGFPEENISLAENMAEKRCEGSEWKLVSFDEVRFHLS
ncbi:hypothetical protein FKW77_007698 [Venturia effusa]|uniref:Uncharacterized protein n=1 Tax=Venturia effusa TaxID=50376 RepID=A0A517KZU2_9PEZI|nr:hypothetical protein FKW77_007698 [Venturia effusa]